MVNPCGSSEPLSVAEEVVILVAGLVVDDGRSGCGKRGKGPVAAVPGAGAVGGHDSEMISRARS